MKAGDSPRAAAALALWLLRVSVAVSDGILLSPSGSFSLKKVTSRLGRHISVCRSPGRRELTSWRGFGESRGLVAGGSCSACVVATTGERQPVEALPGAGDPLVGLPTDTHEARSASTTRFRVSSSSLRGFRFGDGIQPSSAPRGRRWKAPDRIQRRQRSWTWRLTVGSGEHSFPPRGGRVGESW